MARVALRAVALLCVCLLSACDGLMPLVRAGGGGDQGAAAAPAAGHVRERKADAHGQLMRMLAETADSMQRPRFGKRFSVGHAVYRLNKVADERAERKALER